MKDNNERSRNNRRQDGEKANLSEEQIDKIVDRLYKTHTISSRGEGAGQPLTAKDIISNKVNKADADVIFDRLHKTHTKAMKDHPDEQLVARDQISKEAVRESALDQIIDRMYQTHTQASSGSTRKPVICDNSIARKVESAEEITEIFDRLKTTHTKSSSGGVECKEWDRIDPPGQGLKMLPVIDGIKERFTGKKKTSQDELKELDSRLKNTQTTASQARLDPPRILLYPERTTLCNNVDRIRTFQDNGTVAKQTVLERREKWFN